MQRKQRPWCHLHGGDSGGEEGGRPTLGCLCASGPAGRWSAPWGLQSSPVASICGWEYTLGFVCSSPVCALKDPERSLSCSFSKYFAQVSKKKLYLRSQATPEIGIKAFGFQHGGYNCQILGYHVRQHLAVCQQVVTVHKLRKKKHLKDDRVVR